MIDIASVEVEFKVRVINLVIFRICDFDVEFVNHFILKI